MNISYRTTADISHVEINSDTFIFYKQYFIGNMFILFPSK